MGPCGERASGSGVRCGRFDVLTRFAAHVRDFPASRRPGGRSVQPADLRERYESLLVNPTRRVVLAIDDTAVGGEDAVLGMAVLAVDVAGELLYVPVIRVSHLVVERAHRRRGAGGSAADRSPSVPSPGPTDSPSCDPVGARYARMGK